MKLITNERIIPADIDDTLVLHGDAAVTATEFVDIYDPLSGKDITLGVHTAMVRLLKEEKSRGAYILVWSRGGYAWAASVIRALNLEDYVDQVMSKPISYLDDKDVATWMKDRVYLEPGTKYKENVK